LSHRPHHTDAAVSRSYNNDDIHGLNVVILKNKDEDMSFVKNTAAIGIKELLKQLKRSIPNHGPSGHPTSTAYDPDNTFPDRYVTAAARVGSEYYKMMQELHHVESQVIAIGREIARRSRDAYELRRLFRRLFDHCRTVPDFQRVLAIATQRRRSLEALQHVAQPIARALFRARDHATDKRIYTQYYTLITRLEKEGLVVDPTLYNHCVKFAARSRDPVAMQRALLLYRNSNVDLGFRTFRAIVAKFSIGKNGYGEIRNGRWRREDLIPVLTGFPEKKMDGGESDDHHLGSFVKREHWSYVSAWVQILAHCRLLEELWHEWALWRASSVRRGMDSRRKDEFFISYMISAGDPRRAWLMLEESEISFWDLNVTLRTRLFDHLEGQDSDAESNGDGFSKQLLESYEQDRDRIGKEITVS
jgi:hypothetical protein